MRTLCLTLAATTLLGCNAMRTEPATTENTSAPLPGVPIGASPAEVTLATAMQSAAADRFGSEPGTEPDALTLTAECLERGDHANAAVHLETYVCDHPEQILFRLQLAEMLVRLGHDSTAKAHYERFIADVANTTGPACKQLVTAHTRLMEIAQRADDRFDERYHRGAGLLLLITEQEKLMDGDRTFSEEMLCKAMKALVEARELNPSDARTRLALAAVYERMGNARAAQAERASVRRTLLPASGFSGDGRNCLFSDNDLQ